MSKRYIFLLILIVLTMGAGFAQSSSDRMSREEYILKFKDLAISEMKRSGIPASITLAQGCLESSNGNSRLATEGNNHFGIKCKKNWTGKRIHHTDDAPNECFRKYNNAEESYVDHSDFLVNSPRYAALFTLHISDYKQWAHGLKKAGYATDPSYADRLIKIIEDNQLFVYDQGEEAPIATKTKVHEPKNHGPLVNRRSSRLIELRNGLKSIVVQEGDTFESLSKELGMSDWELYHYNDYWKGYQPRVSEILYIEAKLRKTDREHKTYTADNGDSMHFIAQRYGVKLKTLYRRNRMKDGEEPKQGDVIYLRNKRPRS